MEVLAAGQTTDLRFYMPRSTDAALRGRLQAVVWTWLHLGAIGKRSRRGLGSLRWCPAKGDLLHDFIGFSPAGDLTNKGRLEDYLSRGLRRVAEYFPTLDARPPSAGAPLAPLRSKAGWFQLQTINQVFVGKPQPLAFDGLPGHMEDLLHGLNAAGRTRTEQNELGGVGAARLASPMMWRVFQLADGTHVPVMTWSPHDVTTVSGPTAAHLSAKLGFGVSLGGQPL